MPPRRLAAALAFALLAAGGTARAGASPEPRPLREAWEDMRLGRWDVAATSLSRLGASGDASVAAEALYAEGMLWMHRKPGADPGRARATFAELARRFPSHPLAPWAELAIARIPDLDVLRPDRAAAARLYLAVMERHPGSPAAGEAALHRALALSSTGEPSDATRAVAELETWWAAHPHPSLACSTEATLGRLYRYPIGDARKAADHYRRALDLGPASLTQRQAMCWTIARLAEDQIHDRELAGTYYARFLKDFPRHQNVFMALQALQRLGVPAPPTEDTSLEGIRRRKQGGAQ